LDASFTARLHAGGGGWWGKFFSLFCDFQATLAFMLTHLKRVSGRSDVNKMTSSAVARVFGPLFVCPPYRLVRQFPVELARHADLLRYVLEIWPSPSSSAAAAATRRRRTEQPRHRRLADS